MPNLETVVFAIHYTLHTSHLKKNAFAENNNFNILQLLFFSLNLIVFKCRGEECRGMRKVSIIMNHPSSFLTSLSLLLCLYIPPSLSKKKKAKEILIYNQREHSTNYYQGLRSLFGHWRSPRNDKN